MSILVLKDNLDALRATFDAYRKSRLQPGCREVCSTVEYVGHSYDLLFRLSRIVQAVDVLKVVSPRCRLFYRHALRLIYKQLWNLAEDRFKSSVGVDQGDRLKILTGRYLYKTRLNKHLLRLELYQVENG